MHTSKAFMAGVIGGAAMSLLMFMGREVMGMQANLEMMLGTMIGMSPGPMTWISVITRS